jgi:hypothetical protein
VYFEAVGNHKDFDYSASFPPDGYGLVVFAMREADGTIYDGSDIPYGMLPLPITVVQEHNDLPGVAELRQLLEEGREGYVFTARDSSNNYVAYKAKRRELLEEAIDEERLTILTSAIPPAAKIARVVLGRGRVKHILQKLADGILGLEPNSLGIGEDGRWDGSNAVLPTLIEAVKADVREECGDTLAQLCEELKVKQRDVNRALDERVRAAFFDLTLKEALTS